LRLDVLIQSTELRCSGVLKLHCWQTADVHGFSCSWI
jgi:L-rhamnose isomerase